MNRARAFTLGIALAIVLAAVHWRLAGPAPLPETAPADRFSAVRAVSVLRDLLREGVAHPVGTAANAVVRDRILSRLSALGYQPVVVSSFTCSKRPTCATVQNIVAIPQGPGDVVLLVAHYDSVPSGPGASDDGGGVAALLEAVRAVHAGPLRDQIGFLVTDGEEAGLLGAEAFVARQSPRGVKAVVNVDYRGSTGPSYLFETSRGNSALIAAAARALDRPFASSLFFTVYELLPNDTDVSVFKRAGLQAVNFAAIGNVAVYHTALDNLAHVNLRTLQHQGDNVLAMARELAASPLPKPAGNAVYFDVLGFFVVRWPAGWTIWIAIASLIMLLASVVRRTSLRGLLLGVLAFVAVILVSGLLGALISQISHIRAERVAWAQPSIIAAWITGLATALAVAALLRRYTDAASLGGGVAIGWHIAAIAVCLALPGISFLFLVPAVVMSASIALRAEPWTTAAAASVIAAILFYPLGVVLYGALGKVSLIAIAVLIGIASTTFAHEIVAGRRVLLVAFALAAAGALTTLLLPAHSSAQPRRAPVVSNLRAPSVELRGTREGASVRLTVTSTRRIDRVSLRFEPAVEITNVNGFVPSGTRESSTLTVYGNVAAIRLLSERPVAVTATDISYGVPPALEATRAADAVEADRGDVTLSERTARF